MPDKIRNLDSFLPDNLKHSLFKQLKDLFGIPLVIQSCTFAKDDRGYKATVTASFEGVEDKFYVVTRASQPLAVLSYVTKNKLFPFMGKFVANGQAVMLLDPTAPETEEQPQDLPF